MRTGGILAALLFFVVFWFGFLALGGAFPYKYHLHDDHEIISINDKIKEIGLVKTAAREIAADVTSFKRFRPAYYAVRAAEVKILGVNFSAFAALVAFFAAATSVFLYGFAVSAGFSRIEAVLFPLLTLAGWQSVIWWMLGPAETIGMLFLSAGLFAAGLGASASRKKRHVCDAGFIALIILSSLTKESFILFIPAALYLKIMLRQRAEGVSFWRALGGEAVPVSILLAAAAAELLFIAVFMQQGIEWKYAGLESGKPIKYVMSIAELMLFGNGAAAVFCLAVAYLYTDGERRMTALAAGFSRPAVFLVLAALPQAAMYSKTGIYGRYLLPGVIGCSFFVIWGLRYLKEDVDADIASQGDRLKKITVPLVVCGAVLLEVLAAAIFTVDRRILDVAYAVLLKALLAAGLGFAVFVIVRNEVSRRKGKDIWHNGAAPCVKAALGAVLCTVIFQVAGAQVLLARSVSYGRAVDGFFGQMAAATSSASRIVLAAEPRHNYEHIYASTAYLSHLGRRDVVVWTVRTSSDYGEFGNGVAEEVEKNFGHTPQTVLAEAACIGILPAAGLEDAFLAKAAAWFDKGGFKREEFPTVQQDRTLVLYCRQ